MNLFTGWEYLYILFINNYKWILFHNIYLWNYKIIFALLITLIYPHVITQY